MKQILMLFQMGSEVRQLIHSGFTDSLTIAGLMPLVAARPQLAIQLEALKLPTAIIPLPSVRPQVLYEQFAVCLDKAQAKLRKKAGLSTWKYGTSSARKARQRLRRLLLEKLSDALANPIGFRFASTLERRAIASRGEKLYGAFLEQYKPDAIIVTVPRLNYQSYLLSAAERRGIPRFLFFHTNKDVVAVPRFDHQFTAIGVWNAWMKCQLLAQNPRILAKTIHITGCGHFDGLGRLDWLLTEAEFRRTIGVGPTERIVLYTAAGPGIVPAEERYIKFTRETLRRTRWPSARLVVRLNPMDDTTRIEDFLNENCADVIVLRPDWHYSRMQNVCYQREADGVLFRNLLHYSAACVNIPSTLTVECALTMLPIVNIGFDLPGPPPLPGSVRAFWDVDYYANVRSSGAALLAKVPAELEVALQLCIENKCILREEQKRLIALELHNIYPPGAQLEYLNVLQQYM